MHPHPFLTISLPLLLIEPAWTFCFYPAITAAVLLVFLYVYLAQSKGWVICMATIMFMATFSSGWTWNMEETNFRIELGNPLLLYLRDYTDFERMNNTVTKGTRI